MLRSSLVAASLLIAAIPSVAEELGDTSKVHDLDEVTVVSQPKEVFRLRLQPVSSTMLSRQTINLLGLHDLREISSFVPSFVMPDYGSRLTSSVYVRGIGSRVNAPAVGIYVDGMPVLSKSAFNFHCYELERVDVLRGPQGTLYGQNSEGGIVRVYSRNPMHYQGTDLTLSLGSRMYRNAEFAHYSKLSDRLAFSLAGFYGGQNGFFRNRTTGDRADSRNEAGGRLRLIFQPTSRLTLDYIADYQYTRQNGFPYGLLDLATGETASPATTCQPGYRRNMFSTALNVGFKANHFDFHSVTSYQYLYDYMLMDQDYLPEDYLRLGQHQLQNAMSQEFTFKSNAPVGGFWHWTAGTFFSAQWLKTNSPVHFGSAMNTFLSKTVTDYAYNGILNAMVRRLTAKGVPPTAALEQAKAIIARAGGCNIDMQMQEVPGLFRTPTYDLGFFHESNFTVTDRLTATLGLRYDYSHVGIDYNTSGALNLVENVMGQHIDAHITTALCHKTHDDFNQLLPKLGLSWGLDKRGSNLYATMSKGYRSGGYNIQMFSDILQTELSAAARTARGNADLQHTETDYEKIAKTIAYRPETSWNYETGAHLNLFGNTVQLDVSAFLMQVRNQQLSVMAGNYGFGRMMVNAGRSRSCGVELALRGNSLRGHLDWGASYGLTHAVFKEYADSISGQVMDYRNKKVPYVPMHTVAAYADYRFVIASTGLRSITIGGNMNAQGKTYWDEANTYAQKFYAVVGAHADADFGFVKLRLWGRNLTKTDYNTFAVQSGATGKRLTFAQPGNPFQCGVDLKFHF